MWSWELYKDDILVLDSNQPEHFEEPEFLTSISRWWYRHKEQKRIERHKKLCKKCQESANDDTETETIVEKVSEYRAVFYVGGMTCASCVNAVSEAIEGVLGDNVSKDVQSPFSVNLVQHSATVVVPNKQLVNTIVNAILDTGFECKILEILPVSRTPTTKLTAAIGGITCSACANSIQSAVEELPFVFESSINTVTKSGIFVLDGSSSNIETLKTTIEDCGFNFEVLETSQVNYASGKKHSRTANLSVEGMYCGHCPELIHEYLDTYGESLVIVNDLSLKKPIIKFTYFPKADVTIRKIVNDLNHLHPSSTGYRIDYNSPGVFSCEVAVPMSMEEHLKKLAKKEVFKIIIRLIIAAVFAIPTFIFGVVAMSLLPSNHPFRIWVEEPLWTGNVSRGTWIMFILSTPVYFFAADVFHRKALLEIKSLWLHKNSMKKRFFKFGSMNMLMFLGTTIAYITSIVLLILSSQQEAHGRAFHTSYFDSVVFLTFFLLIGRLLESLSKSKTADAVSSLGELKTTTATLVEQSGNDFINDTTVDVKYLEVGDFIRISNGESPPVDCVIVDNSTQFDESAITGESRPVHHEPGHQIFSGTINVGDSIVAKILSLESESLIDQILSTVREGQMKKAPIERVADTITGYFVPIIVMVGVIDFAIWLGLSYGGVLPDSYLDIDIGGWFIWSLQFAIAVFVIACPCGIGLAAPTALFVGSGIAARNGILAKGGGVAFQDGANTKAVCFDKTGTLTHGELEVTDYMFATEDPFLQQVAVQVARDLELGSKHPLAKAVKLFIESMKPTFTISNTKIPTVETVPGRGIKGTIMAEEAQWQQLGTVMAGNETFFTEVLTENQKQILTEWKKQSKSVILVGIENPKTILMMMALRDQLREESKPVIEYLQNKLNIDCWMITGDNLETAQAIAKEIGIPDTHIVAEVLPDEKQQKVAEIKRDNGIVAMVGDGINDAPALASADIGISLASGADLAMNTSDFILLNKQHPLTTLLTLFDLSKVVFRRVKFNFVWALIYNMIGIPIAAGVIYPYKNSRLDPVWASAAMAASSVSVVLSSLALNWYRAKKI